MEDKEYMQKLLENVEDNPCCDFKIDKPVVALTKLMAPWMIYRGLIEKNSELCHIGGIFLYIHSSLGIDHENPVQTFCDILVDMIEELDLVENFEDFKKDFERTCNVEFYRAKAIFAAVNAELALRAVADAYDCQDSWNDMKKNLAEKGAEKND